MITEKDINAEIFDLIKGCQAKETTEKIIKQNKARINYLTEIKKILKSRLTEDQLNGQLLNVEAKLLKRDEIISRSVSKEHKENLIKELDYKNLKQQAKNLKFILQK